MPELPEVQTVLGTLERQIHMARIKAIDIHYPKIIDCNPDLFISTLVGQEFCEFKRRGKYLLFEMNDVTLVVHLRMEGKFFITDDERPLSRHDHVIFYLNDGRQLRYNDTRKFGRMELIEKEKEYLDFKGLGPEPFDERFNVKYCKKYLNKRKKMIKEVLLDQRFVAGIGNIYADEILFAIKVDPRTPCFRLTDRDILNMIKETRNIFHLAIRKGGTTIRSYTSSLGVTGRFQLSLRVHDQNRCPVCDSKIRKIKVDGRGTYFCEKCQKKRYLKIAVTGTIGSGKSEVCNYLRNKGYDVFDCDEENRKLLEKGEEGYLKIREVFSDCFDKEILDKKKLAAKVFADKNDKKKLEEIMHPLILKRLNERKDDPLFAEVPLLFEAGWDKYFDHNILVVTDEKILLKRLVARGMNRKDGKRRLASQMPVTEKIKRADKIIYNNGSLEDLYHLIEETLKELL